MFSKCDFLKSTPNLALTAAILGAALSGCGERSNDATKAEGEFFCEKPTFPLKLSPTVFDPITKLGWGVNGPSFSEQKKDVPMGKFDNQIVLERPVEGGMTLLKIKLDISGTVPTGGIILDTVWYAGSIEVGRAAPSIEIGPALRNTLNTTQAVPTGADRVILVARPWRDIDGILTVGEGEIVWCKK